MNITTKFNIGDKICAKNPRKYNQIVYDAIRSIKIFNGCRYDEPEIWYEVMENEFFVEESKIFVSADDIKLALINKEKEESEQRINEIANMEVI